MGNETSKPLIVDEQESEKVKKQIISKNDEIIRKNVRPKICYPMKAVLRGSRKTGKTSLFKRLQGEQFTLDYNETPEIQVCSIRWELKRSGNDDYCKIDVWDIVDDGYLTPNALNENIKMTGKHRYQPLDSKALDVYQNTQLVIFLIDPFSQTSFDYVKRMYDEVPLNICILILLNFKDLSSNSRTENNQSNNNDNNCTSNNVNNHENQNHNIVVAKESVLTLADEIRAHRIHKYKMGSFIAKSSPRSSPSPGLYGNGALAASMECGAAFFLETSMSNCYGLKDLYKYLSVPFHFTKRMFLTQQMERINRELSLANDTLLTATKQEAYSAYTDRLLASSSNTNFTPPRAKTKQKELTQQISPRITKTEYDSKISTPTPIIQEVLENEYDDDDDQVVDITTGTSIDTVINDNVDVDIDTSNSVYRNTTYIDKIAITPRERSVGKDEHYSPRPIPMRDIINNTDDSNSNETNYDNNISSSSSNNINNNNGRSNSSSGLKKIVRKNGNVTALSHQSEISTMTTPVVALATAKTQPTDTSTLTEMNTETQPTDTSAVTLTEMNTENQPTDTSTLTEMNTENQPTDTSTLTEKNAETQPTDTSAVTLTEMNTENQPTDTSTLTEKNAETQPTDTSAVTLTEMNTENQPTDTSTLTEKNAETQPTDTSTVTEMNTENQPTDTSTLTEKNAETQPTDTSAVTLTEMNTENQPTDTSTVTVTEMNTETQPTDTSTVTEMNTENQPTDTSTLTEKNAETQPTDTSTVTVTIMNTDTQPTDTSTVTVTNSTLSLPSPSSTVSKAIIESVSVLSATSLSTEKNHDENNTTIVEINSNSNSTYSNGGIIRETNDDENNNASTITENIHENNIIETHTTLQSTAIMLQSIDSKELPHSYDHTTNADKHSINTNDNNSTQNKSPSESTSNSIHNINIDEQSTTSPYDNKNNNHNSIDKITNQASTINNCINNLIEENTKETFHFHDNVSNHHERNDEQVMTTTTLTAATTTTAGNNRDINTNVDMPTSTDTDQPLQQQIHTIVDEIITASTEENSTIITNTTSLEFINQTDNNNILPAAYVHDSEPSPSSSSSSTTIKPTKFFTMNSSIHLTSSETTLPTLTTTTTLESTQDSTENSQRDVPLQAPITVSTTKTATEPTIIITTTTTSTSSSTSSTINPISNGIHNISKKIKKGQSTILSTAHTPVTISDTSTSTSQLSVAAKQALESAMMFAQNSISNSKQSHTSDNIKEYFNNSKDNKDDSIDTNIINNHINKNVVRDNNTNVELKLEETQNSSDNDSIYNQRISFPTASSSSLHMNTHSINNTISLPLSSSQSPLQKSLQLSSSPSLSPLPSMHTNSTLYTTANNNQTQKINGKVNQVINSDNENSSDEENDTKIIKRRTLKKVMKRK